MKSVKFLLSGLVIFLLLVGLNLASAAEIQQQKNKTTSFFDLFKNILQSLNNGFIIQPKIQNDSEAVKNYYKNFVEALNRANFTVSEVALMVKTPDNRPLLLEELIKEAVFGKNLSELRNSFALWHQLDERILSELNKLSTNSKVLLFHQTIVNWFNYHSKIAKQFSERNLSREQINQLAQQFEKEAKVHILKVNRSFQASKGLKDILGLFILRAKAQETGAAGETGFYDFGGRVVAITPCIVPPFGFVVELSPPRGGSLYFSGPVLAANPYLWKNVSIGIYELGKAVVAPDACVFRFYRHHGHTRPEYINYEATVIYFGSSLTPSP